MTPEDRADMRTAQREANRNALEALAGIAATIVIIGLFVTLVWSLL